MAKIPVRLEKSESKTGKHQELKIAYIVTPGETPKPVRVGPRASKARPLYSKGTAYLETVDVSKGQLLVSVRLNRNLRGMLTGAVTVYDHNGAEVLRTVIRKRKLRYSQGDRRFAWAVESVLRALGVDKYLRKSSLSNQ